MARVLRTDGIAADLLFCLAVDDDNATLVEWKYTPATPEFTGENVGPPKADTWNGASWPSIPNGVASRIGWTPSNPPCTINDTGGTEVFALRYRAHGDANSATLLLTAGTILNRIVLSSGENRYGPNSTSAPQLCATPLQADTGYILARTAVDQVEALGYVYAEDGTPLSNATAPATFGVMSDYREVCGGADANWIDCDLFLAAAFSRPLTPAELDAFALDPFGSLFENPAVVDPVISGSLVNIRPTSATLELTTDTPNGTLWGILTQDTGTPSAEQIKAGQDATGLAAEQFGSVAITGPTGQLGVTGLTPETTYYAWFVQDASNGATSNVAGGSDTTPALPAPTGDGSLNDEILRATGGPTVNEGLYSWFNGAPPETLNDAMLRSLREVSSLPDGSLEDCWMEYLRILGFTTGSLNDRLLQYWRSQP
jgi:hypothetical protein